MPLSPKTRLGAYEVLGPLGAGGMGEVYRARDLRLGRDVAIKVLPADVASSPERLARFEREARTVAGLNHPNIVTLHSVEDEGSVRFLTMELVEGQTLSTLVAPDGLPLPKLLDLAIPLAEALVAAHEKGVIHRDLKPGNVMVTRDGRVKVLDFGLAKMVEQEAASHEATVAATEAPITGHGEIFGTAPYMAPEQLRGENADARSDLFALGIILYELASGRRPFSGGSPAEITSSILRDTPIALTRIRGDLPGELERIVSRCLEKSPRERFQTSLDVCNDLRRLRRAPDGVPPKAAPQALASIAVLPFLNMSKDPENEYFSDGLAEELLNVLSKMRGLRVAARSSAFTFRGQRVTVAEVGKALNVATVLEGSVRQAGNRVRIAVQLVNAADGYHLWAESYDRTLDDIFAVQDDIAQSVVKALRAKLLGEEADSSVSDAVRADVADAAKGRGHNAEAHRLYLQGRYFVDRHSEEDLARGREHLYAAISADPEHALAWAELSRVHALCAGYGWGPHAEGYAKAREAARRAISLEPDLVEGYAALAWVQLIHDYDYAGSEASFRRALDLAPGNAAVLGGAGWLLRGTGRLEEALALSRRAVENDPLSSAAHHNLAVTLYYMGRFKEAEAAFRKTLELAPQRAESRSNLAMVLLRLGREEEAMREATLEPAPAFGLCALAIVHHAMGNREASDRALRELEAKFANDGAYQVAEAYAARGEWDSAFAWLHRACDQIDGGLGYLLGDPLFTAARNDPRWEGVLTRLGLR
ncbi:MAG TPA: protein kinase [Candidatus Eisenbacteria bacterium]|nr:protein kinase [Candidatus Eisenbacteria bacterium]